MRLKDDLLRHVSLMFFATSLVNVFNLLFQLYMVRNLTPTNYGILNSLFAVLMVISIPAGTIQMVITKFVSTLYAHNQLPKIEFLLFSLCKKVLLFGLSLFLILVFGSRYISSFLQIPSQKPVIIVGTTILFLIILPVALGGLQGLQRFRQLGLSMIISGGLKLLLGVFLVSIGFGVIGAISGFAISTFIALFLSFALLNYALQKPLPLAVSSPQTSSQNPGLDQKIDFAEIYRYFFPVAMTFLCFMLLINIDIILVKHFFDPLKAGYYSVAQMVGKIIIFLPIAITTVMFPKVSNLHAQGKDTLHILRTSILCVGLLCGIAALVCISFPSLVIRLLSSRVYLECIPLARMFAICMTFFALTITLLFYHLSIHDLRFIYPLVICTTLQVILIVLFHKTLLQVLYIMCANSVLVFTINLRLIKTPSPRPK